jgi:VWFA-related protein
MRRSSAFRGPRALLFVSVAVVALWLAQPSARQGGAAGQAGPQPGARAAQGAPQFPPLVFRTEVNYVEVDAFVTDQKGQFVDSLQRGDFEVFEDGKRQELVTFGMVDVPVERADAPLFVKQPIEPDVQTNAKPFDGRIYLLVLDDLHTDMFYTSRVRAAAKRFVQFEMGANDLAAVVSTGGSLDAAQEFTGNKRLLTTAIDRFIGRALRAATLSKLEDYNRMRQTPLAADATPRDTEEAERGFNARNTLSTIRQLSDFMAGVRGRRKALVLFSQGIDYDILDVFNNQYASDVRDETREAIAAATRANVNIYSVDPRGLADMAGDSMQLTGVDPSADPSLHLDTTGLQNELRLQLDSLRVLSDETGGFAAINSNDFTRAFDRIRDENSHYYLLGYYPSNDRRDGRMRKIDVRVARPGLSVRARKSYVAPRGKAPAARPPAVPGKEPASPILREAIDSPLPLSGLRLTVFAAPFKGTAPNASVAVVLQADGRDLKFTERNGRFEDALELSIAAVDRQGKIKGGVRQKVAMPLKPQSVGVVSRSGVRVVSRLDVPPGKYQLRVAALDEGSGVAGSVYYDLEVPDFTAGPLSMSGVVLTSSLAGVGPVVGMAPDDELRKALPGPPTVAREFRSQEEVALLAEVYDNQGTTPHKVDIATTVRSDDGREVFRIADERSSSELQGARGGYGYSARVPLKGLAPGLYVLRVEAKSTLGKSPAIGRDVQIRVVQ